MLTIAMLSDIPASTRHVATPSVPHNTHHRHPENGLSTTQRAREVRSSDITDLEGVLDDMMKTMQGIDDTPALGDSTFCLGNHKLSATTAESHSKDSANQIGVFRHSARIGMDITKQFASVSASSGSGSVMEDLDDQDVSRSTSELPYKVFPPMALPPSRSKV